MRLPEIETIDDRVLAGDTAAPPIPGVVAIAIVGTPRMLAVPLQRGRLVLGREGDLRIDDERASREHAEVRRDAGGFCVRDLGSRNGTFVDAQRCDTTRVGDGAVIRIGRSLALLLDDVRVFDGLDESRLIQGEHVIGPHLARALDPVARAAARGDSVMLQGESGSGKELAARHYHAATGRARGPFVAINCAAIPEGVAERVLLGAKKGAYSGATADADGSIVAAHGGTLFLDEIAELHPAVQGKLLRVLETREVVPLGATRANPVDVRICAASHRDLRAEVAAGRFREDLYFRIGRPSLAIPPLRARKEEIPWLLARTVAAIDRSLAIDPTLIEACCLRSWPGNVREFVAEVRRAAADALDRGAASVTASDLAPDAGTPIAASPGPATAEREPARASTREELAAVLQRCGDNVSATARALGMHRTHLYRLLRRHGLLSRG